MLFLSWKIPFPGLLVGKLFKKILAHVLHLAERKSTWFIAVFIHMNIEHTHLHSYKGRLSYAYASEMGFTLILVRIRIDFILPIQVRAPCSVKLTATWILIMKYNWLIPHSSVLWNSSHSILGGKQILMYSNSAICRRWTQRLFCTR